mmetsp:Transcript_27972/g.73379  ORF Transcript_27972/g.73379 Transcript_27972/m.73379 type:complete len:133 (+) Transcript_27972:31-429(+)
MQHKRLSVELPEIPSAGPKNVYVCGRTPTVGLTSQGSAPRLKLEDVKSLWFALHRSGNLSGELLEPVPQVALLLGLAAGLVLLVGHYRPRQVQKGLVDVLLGLGRGLNVGDAPLRGLLLGLAPRDFSDMLQV